MPRRVEEHPEGGSGLVLVLGRAEIEHRCLGGGVQIVDGYVEMHGSTVPVIADDPRPDVLLPDW